MKCRKSRSPAAEIKNKIQDVNLMKKSQKREETYTTEKPAH